MTSLLAALLLTALPVDDGIAAEPAPIPAQPAPGATAPAPAEPGSTPAATPPGSKPPGAAAPTEPAGAAHLPEATATPGATKPSLPRQKLRILAQDSRLEAYQQFRDLYESAQYEQALPYAKRVVELSEQAAEADYELPIAYNNLGATQYQLADYVAAEASYRKSLDLLEMTQGISSRRLVVPLAGLGAVFAARDEHQLAADLFDRALAVSRRADGLFNLQQLPLIEQAADSRYAISDFGGAEREHMYALKVAEQNYGYGDERTLPALIGLGTFYEGLREFVAARMMYMRARDVAMKKPGYDPMSVRALNGIARCHRLQYTMEPESLDSQQPARDDVTGEMVGKVYRESRVPPPSADRTGLKSVQTALELLRSTPNPPPELMTETLIELGDWFQATARPTIAVPYYAEAAQILEARAGDDPLAGNPLKAPRMVFYRPPVSASRGLNTLSGQYIVRKTVFSFVVSANGEPLDIAVVSTNMDEGQLSQSRRAMSKAIYSPRFSGGQAVSTAGVTFTSEWYEEHDPEKPVPPMATPASSEEKTGTEPATAAAPVETASGPGR